MLDESGDKNWIFDTLTKKPLVTRLFTQMSGSVVTKAGTDDAAESKRGKTRGAKQTDKENVRPKTKAKAKARQGRGNGQSDCGSAFKLSNVPAEQCVGDTVVRCNVGVRPKLWVDDLLACVAHVVTSVQALGLQHEVDFRELKADLIRLGLNFAFQGEIVLHDGTATKQHRRWSRLRPALKQHALRKILQDC